MRSSHIHMVPLPKAVSMVMRNTIRDAKTISGVLWLRNSRTSQNRAVSGLSLLHLLDSPPE